MPKHRERKEEFSIATKLEAFYVGGNVQFTKDGLFMLCSCIEEVKVIDVENGKISHSFGVKGSGEDLTAFILADDDTILVTAAKNGILKQWNIKEKTLMRVWKSIHVGKVSCMAFDSTSTLLATGGSDSTIKVWDIKQKYCTHNLKGAQGVFSILKFLAFNSDLYIFGAADDYHIHVWNLNTSQEIATLEGHCSTVTDFVFIQEKNRLLSCGRDKVVIIWDLNACFTKGKQQLKILPVFEAVESMFLAPEPMLSSLLSNDEEQTEEEIYFVTAGDKGLLRVWKASSGKCLFTQENSLVSVPEDATHEGQVITQADYIPALEAISIVTYEQNIVLHRIHDLALLKQFVGYNDDVLDIKLMGKNNSFMAVATNSPHIKVFELSSFNCQLLKGHLDIVVSLDVFAKDENMLISGSKDNSVRIWRMDQETNEITCIFMGFGHTHSVGAVACSKGKTKFFLSGSEDTTLKLWDIPVKVPLVALKLTLTPRCTVKAHDKNINCIDVALNDKLIATSSQDCTAKIWNASDLSLVGTMRGHKKGVWCVTFSPIDLVLATSSGDGTVKIWSLTDFSVLKTFVGHDASVFKVYFLSRGTQLISCASDGLIKLWDIRNNECMKTYDGHEDKVWALAVSSKEDFLVSGAADSNIIIWKDVTQEMKEKSFVKQEEMLLRDQELSNLIHRKKWRDAVGLAITLDQPFRALNIIKEILLTEERQTTLDGIINEMGPEQISALLRFISEWNTNSRNAIPAQFILNIIFKRENIIDELLKFPERRTLIETLLPYSERHLSRIDKMEKDAHILTFLWHNMRLACNS